MIWIASPLAYYASLAAGIILCLVLFLTVKRENTVLRQRLDNERDTTRRVQKQFSEALANLERAVTEHEAQVPVAGGPIPQSINLTKRSQALRMYRRGESVEQISSALQMPQREVDLLIKVQQTLAGTVGQ